MKKTSLICDCCKKENESVRSVTLFADRKSDGAGGSESYYYRFELCSDCLVLALKCVIEDDLTKRDSLTRVVMSKFNKHGDKGMH